MNRLFTGLLFCALQSPCISQTDSIVFTVDWAQQFSNGHSAYFEEIVKSGDSLFVAGQWYQGSMANQLAMAIDAESGSVIWEHYRDCCSDHARYYKPVKKNDQLYFFGTQNGQGSSYFDVVFVEYDPQTGSEIEFTTWNYPGSNSFADVGINNSGEFVVLSNAASVQPLAIYEDHSQLFQTTIPNQPDFGRLTGLFHVDEEWFLYGAWEAHNLPGIIKLDENLSIEWSQTVGESGNRRVFCGLHDENQFVLAGRDENLERGFVVVSDLEGNLESEIIFDPWLSSYSSVGSIAKYENGYFLTIRDFDALGATTWLLALNESFEITGKINLGEDFQFINGSISGRASAGNIVVSESSIFISGYENQNGFETPTLFKIEWAPALVVPGCTDSTACNFNEEANEDDGSCIPSGCMEPEACNYNALAECEGEACDYTCCPGPGCCSAGMYWDYDLEQCMNYETCQDDLDGDGVIGVNDLMQLLSSFGTDCAPAEEPETTEWTCGDPVSYHGYDYATVQIGEQCWFAENLRTELYQNGDSIPGDFSASDWGVLETGAYAVYESNENNLTQWGRMYNWFSAIDIRNVCPAGWSVPSEETLNTLLVFVEENEWGVAELKAESGWASENGSNLSGFNFLPGGYRKPDGSYTQGGNNGYLWTTSSIDEELAFGLTISSNVYVPGPSYNVEGFSVRCLKD